MIFLKKILFPLKNYSFLGHKDHKSSLDIVFLWGTGKTRAFKLRQITAWLIVGGITLCSLSFVIFFGFYIITDHQNKVLSSIVSELKTDLFDMQSRYEKVFDRAYPKTEIKTERDAKENLDESKTKKAKDPENPTNPSLPDKKNTALDVDKILTLHENFVELKSFFFIKKENSALKIKFEIHNLHKESSIYGYLWGVILDAKNEIVQTSPANFSVDKLTLQPISLKKGYPFQTRNFTPKIIDFSPQDLDLKKVQILIGFSNKSGQISYQRIQ